MQYFLTALSLGAVLARVVAPPLSIAAERAIDKELVVSATLDQAWDAWTTRDGIVSFFAPDARVEGYRASWNESSRIKAGKSAA